MNPPRYRFTAFHLGEAFEMALKSFITGLLYERSVEICRTHGLEFDEDGEVVDGE